MTHAHDGRLTLTPPKPCPGCNSTGKHRPFCPEVYAMTFAPQPRPTLASLSDAQVRALLVMVKHGDARWRYDDFEPDAETEALLAEAQRIADGLSEDAARILAGETTAFYVDEVASLVGHGLLREEKAPPFARYDLTPLGTLVQALRERSKVPESSADELERLAQEHEDEEYRYRESQGEERRGK